MKNIRHGVKSFGESCGAFAKILSTRTSGLKELVQVFNCACDAWTHHKAIENLEHAGEAFKARFEAENPERAKQLRYEMLPKAEKEVVDRENHLKQQKTLELKLEEEQKLQKEKTRALEKARTLERGWDIGGRSL